MHTCAHTDTRTYIVCTCTHARTHTYTHTHTHIHTRTHARARAHTQITGVDGRILPRDNFSTEQIEIEVFLPEGRLEVTQLVHHAAQRPHVCA